MPKIKIFLPLAFFFGVIFFSAGYLAGQGKTPPFLGKKELPLTPSSNILFLTNPVTSFYGKVEKITGDILTVSQEFTLQQPLPYLPPGENLTPPVHTPTPFPTPIARTITYKVKVTPHTQIFRPAPFIPYLRGDTHKNLTPTPPAKLSLKDIKVGQNISISSKIDLRFLKDETFEAATINLPAIQNTLTGKISKISGNSLTIKATPPSPLINGTPKPPQEKEYVINVTSATEISRFKPAELPKAGTTPTPGTPPPPEVEEFKLSDLKPDWQITIFSIEDVTETEKLTALRIEPIPVPPSPPPIAPSPVSQPTSLPSPNP